MVHMCQAAPLPAPAMLVEVCLLFGACMTSVEADKVPGDLAGGGRLNLPRIASGSLRRLSGPLLTDVGYGG